MLSCSTTKNRSLLERTQMGSLPLKKRRFFLEKSTTAPITPTPTTSTSTTHFWSPPSMATPSPFHTSNPTYLEVPTLHSCGMSPNPGAVLAGLSLIAAAANNRCSSSSSPMRIPTLFDPQETSCSTNSSTPYCTDEKESTDMESNTEELDEEDDRMTDARESEAASSQAAPPATCHGLTSRHHTLCRRQAGYKGSNYCKLHYQQHQLVQAKEGKILEQKLTLSSACTQPQQQQHPQDKRYVEGGEHERCRATTTRGRACAYVAVDGTRFCNLHADYDRNPPPRRARTRLPTSPTVDEDKESSSLSLTIAPTVSTDSATNFKKPPSRIRGKHLDSPFPLLSQLSTDQWFKKRVRIGTGPWEGEIGTVEKWGNGWVSVQIEGVIGFHNRRSFELYLADDDDNGKASDHKVIRRCVTREAWSSSPQPLSVEEGRNAVEVHSMHIKVPRAMETSIMSDSDDNANNFDNIDNKLPMSPRMKPLCTNSDFTARGDELSFASATPVGAVRRVAQIRRVTPSSTRSTRTSVDIPLMETILMSPPPHHQCGTDNAKLDGSLYGTAALERGRRTIHKPSRYEDVEMLVAIKRSRRISSDDDAASDI